MSSMYSLTAMTGREASANRTVVIGTIEFNWRVWIIMICAAPVALVTTGLLWPFVGQVAIAAIPVVEIAAVWLIHRRTSQGLRLRTYQAFWDKRKATVDQFFLCGQPIEIDRSDYRQVTPNTVAYAVAAPANTAQVVETAAPPRRARRAVAVVATPAPLDPPRSDRPAPIAQQAPAFPVDALGLASMAARQRIIESAAGRSVDSLRDLTHEEAIQVLSRLVQKPATRRVDKSAWDERDEDTWIDRM